MKNKLFTNTRWRLTILYTSFLIIFLVAFIAITYFSLLSTITHDQKEQAVALAHKEYEDHHRKLLEWEPEDSDDLDDIDDERDDDREDWLKKDIKHKKSLYYSSLSDQTFYYIVANDGMLIDSEGISIDLLNDIQTKIGSWEPKKNEVRQIKVNVDEWTEHFIISGQSLYDHGKYVGTIFSGTNITEQTHIIQTLLLILSILAFIFIIASAFLGYWMAGRAMGPIFSAFNKQKQFTADASHELRTPLTIMQSSLEVIEAEDRDKLSSFSQTVLDDLKDEVKRMAHLVNNMLVLARSDLNAEMIKKDWFRLAPVLEKLQRKFQTEADKNGISIELAVAEDLNVYGDHEKITQLLFILVDNALKYNKDNGFVQIAACKENNQIRIDVSDTGIGIGAEHQKRIFDRFYRVDPARSREAGSSGIGLSIADWIVRVHNGKLEVKSEEGKGSTFSIFLPLPK